MLNPEKDNFVLAIQSKFLDLSYPVGHKCLGLKAPPEDKHQGRNFEGILCTSSVEKLSSHSPALHLEKLAFHRNVRTFKFFLIRGSVYYAYSIYITLNSWITVRMFIFKIFSRTLESHFAVDELHIPRCLTPGTCTCIYG